MMLILFALLLGNDLHPDSLMSPQRPGAELIRKATSSSTLPVSSRAVVTYMVRGTEPSPSDLLFVVWRGAVKWHGGTPRASSGGGGEASFAASATFREVSLGLEVDLRRRVATVQGHAVELGDANIILVDAVDTPTPRIVGTRRIERIGAISAGPAGPLRILGTSPEVLDFAGCGPTVPEAERGWCVLLTGR